MGMGTGIQICEWEYNNGNEFSKLNGNQLLFAQIACDVLAPLQYALGLVADAAITLTQFDISDWCSYCVVCVRIARTETKF